MQIVTELLLQEEIILAGACACNNIVSTRLLDVEAPVIIGGT